MNTNADPWVGQKLGKYTLTERLGGGGGGSVYAAYDEMLDREVALKLFAPQSTATREMAARFQQEARLTARLNHPGIVPIYDVGEDRNVSYIAMRRLPGNTLSSRITNGPLSENEAISITLALCEALAYAHTRNVVHRDLKPANVLFDEENRPMLVDFGIAKALDGQQATLTEQGTVVGTPPYMSPEQVTGQGVDQRSDIYSLGILLYQMVTGRPPFSGTSYQVMAAHRDQPPPMPHILRPNINPNLERVILKALAKSPEGRFQTAPEFAEALRAVQRGESTRIVAPPPAPSLGASQPTRVYGTNTPTGDRPISRAPKPAPRPSLEAGAGTSTYPTRGTVGTPPVVERGGFPIWSLIFLLLLMLCVGSGAVAGALYYPAFAGGSGNSDIATPNPGGVANLPTATATIAPLGETPTATPEGLPTLPVPEDSTPTNTPEPSATPQPTNTPEPSATVESTVPPTATSPATATLAPTNTPEPTATQVPSPTPTETVLCDITVDPNFDNFFDPNTMGCPTDVAYDENSPVQQFQQGFMLYDPTLGIVYAFDTVRFVWGSYVSEWDPEDDPYSCEEAEDADGPTGDFGYVWCANPDVQIALGDIITQEIFSPVTFQSTEQGQLMNIPALFSQIAIFQDRTFIQR
jgi:hypothetical protein